MNGSLTYRDLEELKRLRSALAPLRRFLELADRDGALDSTALVLCPMSRSELRLAGW